MTHGWNQEVLQQIDIDIPLNSHKNSPVAKADRIVQKLKQVREWAQASMAAAQNQQELNSNRLRNQAPSYKIGDKVWLSLENIKTDRPCKKLDARYAKFTVTEVVGSHSFRLNTPPGIHNVFHIRLLLLANSSHLPGQIVDDSKPPSIIERNRRKRSRSNS